MTTVELNPQNFLNRELSTLEFARRVLSLSKESTLPLLERLKFLAIVGNNIDEFFMVRVGNYIQKARIGLQVSRPDGYTPAQLLAEIRREVLDIMSHQRVVMGEILHELEEHGIYLHQVQHLNDDTQHAIRNYFFDEVYPVLTPLAADHARPFPFISNLSLNLAVSLKRDEDNHLEFVRIKVPNTLPRLVNLGKHVAKYGHDLPQDHFVWIEDVIAHNLDLLFPGMEIIESFPFRITRNVDIDYEHEQDLDLLEIIEAGVHERQFGFTVRLSVPVDISDDMLERLIDELEIDPNRDIYHFQGGLGSSSLFELSNIDRPELKYPPYIPKLPPILANQPMELFAAIREGDMMLYHPYDSFAPVEEFFRQAAKDPAVLAIKATLYRVGRDSNIVQSLLDARESDKQVAVLVELKARFDEENNLEWARQLEQNGVHVTYGVEELPVKTHAKVSMVIRREADGLRRYVHLGTGNYNPSTARMYSDLSVFTTDNEIASDATRLFNRLTGYAPGTTYQRLLVAPEFLQQALIALIDNEIEAAKAGKEAHLIFKMNQLEDDVMIAKLYEASQAGVKVDLIVRGICCLWAGLPDFSENIRVISILGRFLEHPRIYYFKNAPEDQQLYAGSADLMRRNLYNRVEVVFPILDPAIRQRIMRILISNIENNVLTWEMHADGKYHRRQVAEGQPLIDSQAMSMLEDR
jgi:polyphosphate kinase